MVQESLIKKLLDRRVPQIFGSYFVAATNLIFIEIIYPINILIEYLKNG